MHQRNDEQTAQRHPEKMYRMCHLVDKVKKIIEKYGDLIDGISTQEKLTLVISELDELKEIAANLNRIQKMLPALDSSKYVKYREQYANHSLLITASQLETLNTPEKVGIKSQDNRHLSELRQEHRHSIDSLFELNSRVINNLGSKLAALKAKYHQ